MKKFFFLANRVFDDKMEIWYNDTNQARGMVFLILVIAEKPVLARNIAAAIHAPETHIDGAIQKGDYVITWAWGHLLTLKEPEDYDPELKKWSLDALPLYFDNWGKKPNQQSYGKSDGASKGKETQIDRLNTIKKYMDEADMIIHAGDPDDEGQYLIDELLEYFNCTKPVKRLATANTSEAALERALKQMDDNASHVPAGKSAYARSVADLMVGVNLTRYYTLKNPPALLSIGRVQTPTLGLVVRRDMQIENHQVQHYYTINAKVNVDGTEIMAKYNPKKDDPNLDDGRILQKKYAEEILQMLTTMGEKPCSVTVKQEKEQPPLPFNLVELQSYCEKKWGYSPSDTLKITQSLRDNYSAISYNRTDCQYLSSDQFNEAPDVMASVVKNINYKPKGMDMTIRSRAFDDAYVQGDGGAVAHLAIIPQQVEFDISKLTASERNVYLAICQYYMAQFMPPAVKQITSFGMDTPDGASLKASSTKILEQGYRVIFRDAEEVETSALSGIAAGDYQGEVVSGKIDEADTKPPARYTQASLGKDMTRIAKYVDDPKIKEIMLQKDKDKRGENGSIGTEATRADIISHLLARGYLEEDGKKKIKSTPLGRELYRILPDQLRNPDMTALWWCIQEDIKKGKATPDTLTQSVLEMIKDIINVEQPKVDMSIIPDKYKRKGGPSREPLGNCPRCGKPVIEGKTGYGCSGWKDGCKFVIWKKPKTSLFKDESITAADVRSFLKGKKVKKKKLYSQKSNKNFEAYLIMEDDPNSQFGPGFKLEFEKKGSK